jgi:hypothetical protein
LQRSRVGRRRIGRLRGVGLVGGVDDGGVGDSTVVIIVPAAETRARQHS